VNRFLVFAGDYYYPKGGWKDFKGAFSSYENALKCINKPELGFEDPYEWWHIIDETSLDYLCKYETR